MTSWQKADAKYPYSPDGSYAMTPEFPFFDPVAVMGVVAGDLWISDQATGKLIRVHRA